MRIEINISEEEARRIKWFLQRRYRKKKTVKLKTLILLAIRTEVVEEADMFLRFLEETEENDEVD